MTQQAVTQQAVTQQAMTQQAVTQQAVTQQAVTQQAVTQQAAPLLSPAPSALASAESLCSPPPRPPRRACLHVLLVHGAGPRRRMSRLLLPVSEEDIVDAEASGSAEGAYGAGGAAGSGGGSGGALPNGSSSAHACGRPEANGHHSGDGVANGAGGAASTEGCAAVADGWASASSEEAPSWASEEASVAVGVATPNGLDSAHGRGSSGGLGESSRRRRSPLAGSAAAGDFEAATFEVAFEAAFETAAVSSDVPSRTLPEASTPPEMLRLPSVVREIELSPELSISAELAAGASVAAAAAWEVGAGGAPPLAAPDDNPRAASVVSHAWRANEADAASEVDLAPLSWAAGLALALAANGLELNAGEANMAAAAAAARGRGNHRDGADGRQATARASTLARRAREIVAGLGGPRPASALAALTMLGWSIGWRDGTLADALTTLAPRVRLEQWRPLLLLAREADEGRRRRASSRAASRWTSHRAATTHWTKASRPAHGSSRGPAAAVANGADEADGGDGDGSSGAGHAAGRATLLVLRGMLSAQPATVCLGVLRGEPALAEALPPRGYVELLRAVAREHEKQMPY